MIPSSISAKNNRTDPYFVIFETFCVESLPPLSGVELHHELLIHHGSYLFA
jgi:hypothetical protein